jgi:hypothetical protein
MRFGLKKAMFAVVAAAALGTAAQASEVSVTTRANDNGVHHRIADYTDGPFERRQYRQSEYRYEHRDPDRYYGRPVPEWRERRSYQGGYRSIPVVERPHWQWPVLASPGRGYHDGCRTTVKERVNRWGDLVEVRRKVCR